MTWLNATAWIGATAIIAPIIIHLLGQIRARVLPFPTLRFIGHTALLPTRRTQLHDIPLLLVRIAILLAAVAALARPLFSRAAQQQEADATLARAVIVDTSEGRSAMQRAKSIADSATSHLVIATTSPRGALDGAAEWLATQRGRSEIVIVSSFHAGTIDSIALATLAPATGIRLLQIPATVDSTRASAEIGPNVMIADATPVEGAVDVDWRLAGRAKHASPPTILAAPADAPDIAAAQLAATNLGGPVAATDGQTVRVVFPDYPDRQSLLQRTTTALTAPMAATTARLRQSALLHDAAQAATAVTADIDTNRSVVVLRDRNHRPLLLAATDSSALLLFANTNPGSLVAAALFNTLRTGVAVRPIDARTIPDSTLQRWHRDPAPRAASQHNVAPDDASDARWFWLGVLALLGIERVMRHRIDRNTASEAARAAVA